MATNQSFEFECPLTSSYITLFDVSISNFRSLVPFLPPFMSAQWTFPFISVWFRHYAPCCTALFVGQTEKCMSCHLCFPTSWSYEYLVGLFCARCHMLHAQLTAVTPPHWESTPSCELEPCNLTFSLGTAACSDNWSRRTVNCKLWTANCKRQTGNWNCCQYIGKVFVFYSGKGGYVQVFILYHKSGVLVCLWQII